MKAKSLITGMLLAVVPAIASAQILYQQTTLETSDRGAYQDFCQQLADDFVPVATGSVTSATWQGSYYGSDAPGPTVSFTLQIFADNSGVPANAPLYQLVGNATQTAAGTHLGKTLYDYSLATASPTLNAGTTYWFSVYTNAPCSNYAWANSTDGTSNGYALRNSGGGWTMSPPGEERENHVFTLSSTGAPPVSAPQAIPLLHPALLAILAVALGGLGAMQRRNHSR